MRTVNFEEAKLPSELLNTIANGELILITLAYNPVAILSPVSITQSIVKSSQPINTSPKSPKIQRQLGTAKDSIWMSDDFNEPLDDLTGYKP
jgi:antitoxin (DNA-binding transcriptional repressor) of toxin-antitoxin stability system